MSKDTETPLTDALVMNMLCGDGVPVCKEWDLLVDHAKEMERRSYAYRAVAAAVVSSR